MPMIIHTAKAARSFPVCRCLYCLPNCYLFGLNFPCCHEIPLFLPLDDSEAFDLPNLVESLHHLLECPCRDVDFNGYHDLFVGALVVEFPVVVNCGVNL